MAPTKEELYKESRDLPEQDQKQDGFRWEIRRRMAESSPRGQRPESGYPKENHIVNLKISPQEIAEYLKSRENWKERLSIRSPELQKIFSVDPVRANSLGLDSASNPNLRVVESNRQNIQIIAGIEANPSLFASLQANQNINQTSQRFLYRDRYQSRLKHLELDVPLYKSLSAIFSAGSGDIYDDRQNQLIGTNMALAGFSIKGEKISTRVVAGDSSFNGIRGQYNPAYLGATEVQKLNEPGFNNRDSIHRRSFEWQTNLTPAKGVRFQTALYNQPLANVNRITSTDGPDSGRMSLFLGEKNVVLNLKYDYQFSNQNIRSVLNQWTPEQDAASVGFIFFLDPAQKYSLYLGGNQYNIADRTSLANRGTSDRNLPGFSASIRGKNSGNSRANFFLNFQNQPPGAFGLGVPSAFPGSPGFPGAGTRGNFEQATTLGMEVIF